MHRQWCADAAQLVVVAKAVTARLACVKGKRIYGNYINRRSSLPWIGAS
jgi:hypothetical protein